MSHGVSLVIYNIIVILGIFYNFEQWIVNHEYMTKHKTLLIFLIKISIFNKQTWMMWWH